MTTDHPPINPAHNGITPFYDPNLYGPGKGDTVYIHESENTFTMSNTPLAGMPAGLCGFCGQMSEVWASDVKDLIEMLTHEYRWKITKRGNLMCPKCQTNKNPHLK